MTEIGSDRDSSFGDVRANGIWALGTGLAGGVTWRDFGVDREPSGKPLLILSGAAASIAAQIGVRKVHLTLTHTAELAMAFVVIED